MFFLILVNILINKLWNIYVMECYVSVKINELNLWINIDRF